MHKTGQHPQWGWPQLQRESAGVWIPEKDLTKVSGRAGMAEPGRKLGAAELVLPPVPSQTLITLLGPGVQCSLL